MTVIQLTNKTTKRGIGSLECRAYLEQLTRVHEIFREAAGQHDSPVQRPEQHQPTVGALVVCVELGRHRLRKGLSKQDRLSCRLGHADVLLDVVERACRLSSMTYGSRPSLFVVNDPG